jgi:hypothetical protein
LPDECYYAEIRVLYSGEIFSINEQSLIIKDDTGNIIDEILFAENNLILNSAAGMELCFGTTSNQDDNNKVEIQNNYLRLNGEIFNINIYDLNGALIASKNNIKEYNVNYLNHGVYFYEVNSSSDNYYGKFIK